MNSNKKNKIYSLDDMAISNHFLRKVQKMSKDDIKIRPTRRKPPAEQPLEKKSRIGKFFSKVGTVWENFKNSKVGKVLFSNSLSYAISVGSIAIALSGLLTPISPIIIGVAAATAFSMGVHAISTTLKIHSLRKLQKENNLIVQYRNSKEQQEYILSTLDPGLKQVLKDELYKPLKDFPPKKYKISPKIENAVARVIGNNAGLASTLASNILEGASGNVLAILKATGYGIMATTSLISDGLTEKEKYDVETIFKTNINEENSKPDTPYYKNLKQLEDNSKKQIIQTVALKRLITSKEPNYWKMKDEEKKEKFIQINTEINKEITRHGLQGFLKNNNDLAFDNKGISMMNSINTTLNPFSILPIQAPKYTPLAKVKTSSSRNSI